MLPATLEEAASTITGDAPRPRWLNNRLQQMSKRIRAYVEAEESAPKRTEIRNRMEAFRQAIMLMQEEMSDFRFVTYLGNDWAGLPADLRDVLATLAEIGNRAGELSMKFSGRAGAQRAFPTERHETISSQQLCAWTVMEAMRRCRGISTVSADNREAWRAANLLYRFSGGEAMGKQPGEHNDGRDPSGWRDHIDAVQHMERESSARSDELATMAAVFAALTLDDIDNP